MHLALMCLKYLLRNNINPSNIYNWTYIFSCYISKWLVHNHLSLIILVMYLFQNCYYFPSTKCSGYAIRWKKNTICIRLEATTYTWENKTTYTDINSLHSNNESKYSKPKLRQKAELLRKNKMLHGSIFLRFIAICQTIRFARAVATNRLIYLECHLNTIVRKSKCTILFQKSVQSKTFNLKNSFRFDSFGTCWKPLIRKKSLLACVFKLLLHHSLHKSP